MADDVTGIWELGRLLNGMSTRPQPDVVPATVVGTDEEGTVWVRLPGADEDTPANGVVLAEASPGQQVLARVEGGSLSLIGNATAPAVGGTYVQQTVAPVAEVADEAAQTAGQALDEAERAHAAADAAEQDARAAAQSATSAQGSAQAAQQSATAAQGSAADAATAAELAQAQVADARQSAQDAAGAAQGAQQSAGAASASARDAATSAGAAATSAADAAQSAGAAQAEASAATSAASAANASATRANAAASDALNMASVVQDVAGTLAWIGEHGSYVATADAEPAAGKVYFARDAQTGEYAPVTEPDAQHMSDYYELSVADSQSDYIMAHLAVTSAGLWVLPDGIGQAQTPQQAAGYKMLLASTGAYLYDGAGHLVRSDTAQGTAFDSSTPVHIGGEDAFVAFYDSDGDGVPDSIRIGGSNVSIGGSSLSQVLADVAQASADAADALDSATITITSTNGLLFKHGAESTVLQVAVFPNGGGRLDTIAQVRSRFGAGARIEWRWKHDDGTWGTMLSDDPHIGNGGMWLTVTPADVAAKTSFEASLVV